MNRTRNRARNGGGVSTPLRVIEVQARVPSNLRSQAASNCKADVLPIRLVNPSKDIILAWNNYYSTSSTETNNSVSVTIVSAALVCPNGTVIPIYFGGSRTKILAAGDWNVQCDAIYPSQASYSQFPVGNYIVRQILKVPANGNTFATVDETNTNDNVAGTQVVYYDDTLTTISSTDTTGSFTVVSGAAFNSAFGVYFCKPMMFGRPISDTASYIGLGDSIATGFGETANGAHRNIGGVGVIQRMAYNANTNPVPMINYSISSAQITLATNNTKWRSFIPYAKYALVEYGTNDVTSVAIGTIQTNLQTLWGILRTNGIKKIMHLKLLVRTTSTDSWITEAYQTALATWAPSPTAVRYQFEQYLTDKVADGTIDILGDMGITIKGTDQDKWKVNGAVNFYTSDGIHPNITASPLCASDARPSMLLT